MPQAGLSDSQKLDLYKIWSRHSEEVHSEESSTTSAANSSSNASGPNATNSIALNDRSLKFVARLTSFFLHTLDKIYSGQNNHCNRSSNDDNFGGDDVAQEEENGGDVNLHSALYDTFQPFFPSFHSMTNRNHRSDNHTAAHAPLIPRIHQGRHVVIIDHRSFLSELEAYEGRQYIDDQGGHNMTFGAFLYHKPSHGICVTNSAIALTLMTLHRRSRTNSRPGGGYRNTVQDGTIDGSASSPLSSIPMIPPESIIIRARYENVFPSIEIQDVKTSNAYKFISLQGRIIKSHPKRLRLITADVMCIRCGHQFEHRFQNGVYELPNRCRGIPPQTNSNNDNHTNNNNTKKCQGQKFELLRRTAKYTDCQMLRLQEEDNVNSTAGRAPRHIDLEVTHDLVDMCHAGDCVRVTGVIQAVNSTAVAGRGGKRAAETSTFSLYMKANSIVNTTAELHERKKKVAGGAGGTNRGLTFTDDQLEKITRVAHAGKWIYVLRIIEACLYNSEVHDLVPA